MVLRQAAREALIIFVVAMVIGGGVYIVRPDKIKAPSEATKAQSAVPAEEKGYSIISIDAAYDLYQEQTALFADARHALDFDAGHIKGAVNLTVAESMSWLPDFLAATDPATPIIAYCDGENCHLAPELAELLFFNGFETVHYLENGWTRWRQRGFPVE